MGVGWVKEKEKAMPQAYSEDLRRKVIARLEAGGQIKTIADQFGIGTATVQRWWSRWRTDGVLAGRQGSQPGHGAKITDLTAFAAYVAATPDKTQEAMGRDWGVSRMCICRTLRRMGWTYKKRPLATGNGIRNSGRRS
jgi:transposase